MFERKSNKTAAPATPPADKNADKNANKSADSTPAPAAKASTNTPMSASGADTPSKSLSGAIAMIGSKVTVKGDIISGEDLLVEGEVHGTITLAENELVIGSSGRVEANITAKTIRIEGEVKGDIDGTERVVICASGNVQGNVSSPRVMLEDGGRFRGSIDMGSSAGNTNKNSGPSSVSKAAAAAGSSEVHNIDKSA